jgi:hypothetical protein
VPGVYDALRESRTRKELAQGYDDGRVQRFLDAVWKKEKLSPAEGHAIMNVCMAATYDPDAKAPLGFRIPFNMETGERLDDRWKRWRQHDPIHLVGRYADALRSLKGSTSIAAGATSITSTTGRESCRCGWRKRASPTATRSSTTITRMSTTGWT